MINDIYRTSKGARTHALYDVRQITHGRPMYLKVYSTSEPFFDAQ